MANGTPVKCCICGTAEGTEKVWFERPGTRTLRLMCTGCEVAYARAVRVPVGSPGMGPRDEQAAEGL